MIEPCRACGTRNSIPAERLHQRARCASCNRLISPLVAPHPVHSIEEFDELVNRSPLPVVVDVWSPSCADSIAREMEKVARTKAGGAVVVELNADEVPEVAERLSVTSLPTFIVFHHGHETTRITGPHPAADILNAFTTGV